jgi:hypothetical protein
MLLALGLWFYNPNRLVQKRDFLVTYNMAPEDKLSPLLSSLLL